MKIEIVQVTERPYDEQAPEANPYAGVARIDEKYDITFTSPIEDVVTYLHTIEPQLQELIDNGKFSLPPPSPPVFTPPDGTGLPEKIDYIEQFLTELYPGG